VFATGLALVIRQSSFEIRTRNVLGVRRALCRLEVVAEALGLSAPSRLLIGPTERWFSFGVEIEGVEQRDHPLEVGSMADLDEISVGFYEKHGRRLPTKYKHLTRRFFAKKGVTGCIVESGGATEGAPAAGAAEVIVDITITGSTLAANDLKALMMP